MMRLLKHDLRRLTPNLLLVIALAAVLPYCVHFLRFIYDTEAYNVVARLSFYGFLAYIVSGSIFTRNFSQLFGKEAYFYRTIPLSNRRLLIEKFLVLNFGILVCALGIVGLELNDRAVALHETGFGYLAAYGQVIGSSFTKINLFGFFIAMIVLMGFVAQAFCAGQMTMSRFIERFRGGALYLGLGFFWWIADQVIYGLCIAFVPGVVPLEHNARVINFSGFKMYSTFGLSYRTDAVGNLFPIVGLGLAMFLMLALPIGIYLQLGKRNVNLR